MKTDQSSKFFRPSLLDCLLRSNDDGEDHSSASGWGDAGRLQDVQQFTASLCRDLENLLNARSSASDVPRWAQQCATSILNYGLPDRAFDCDAAGASRMVRDTITTFEPRLCDVRVEQMDTDFERFDRSVLQIKARLVAERGTAIRLWVRFRSFGIERITVTQVA
jgi:type VI secretion system lysozyme-like protein